MLFDGREILKKEDLISLPTESYVRNSDGKVHENRRDVKKADKNRKIYNGMLKTYFYQFLGPKPPKPKKQEGM